MSALSGKIADLLRGECSAEAAELLRMAAMAEELSLGHKVDTVLSREAVQEMVASGARVQASVKTDHGTLVVIRQRSIVAKMLGGEGGR